jgi:hypothetical protein
LKKKKNTSTKGISDAFWPLDLHFSQMQYHNSAMQYTGILHVDGYQELSRGCTTTEKEQKVFSLAMKFANRMTIPEPVN